ncbi:MAG: RNA polymerase sigma factor [Pirellula sp.]|jgi:RNA polymerase sigma factor (sigma-70 family)
MKLSDCVLASAKSGDASSINSVMEFSIRVAKSFCGRHIDNRSDVDDIAQTVAIKVYKHLPTCDAETVGQFMGFIARITRTTCYDFYRSAQCRFELMGDCDVTAPANEFAGIDAGDLVNTAARYCDAVEFIELSMSGYSQSEIGKRLGVTKRIVQARLDRHKKTVQSMVA